MKIPPEPRLRTASPEAFSTFPKNISSPYSGMQRKNPYEGLNKKEKTASPYGVMRLPEQIRKPLWRRPLTKSWRVGISHAPRKMKEDD